MPTIYQVTDDDGGEFFYESEVEAHFHCKDAILRGMAARWQAFKMPRDAREFVEFMNRRSGNKEFIYDEKTMFPFATSKHTTTD